MFNNITTGHDMSDATLEIIIMLAGAFILGSLFRHAFSSNTSDVNDANAISEQPENVEKSGEAPIEISNTANSTESLLQVIGIDAAIEKTLHSNGITTMRQLATVDFEQMLKFFIAAEVSVENKNPESWSPQAELIVDENWQELENYQNYLATEQNS